MAAVVLTLGLTGCSGGSPAPVDGRVSVVASTDVYGELAKQVGGDLVSVTSILDDPAQDPHSFEANPRVQLALSTASVVIENGGGYDDWADTLLAGAHNPKAVVLNAVDISGFDQNPSTGDFNEHVFYDLPTMSTVADRLAAALSSIAPAHASEFAANAATFEASLGALETREKSIAAAASGRGAAITEPVPLYMLQACGLHDVTPPAFSKAIEDGTDVSPLDLQATLALFPSHVAALLAYNAQTTGPQTDRIVAAAKAAGVPVIGVTETIPAGDSYLGWMSANLDAIQAALK
jgi:zinc/manganese transport system substrate-binding protein